MDESKKFKKLKLFSIIICCLALLGLLILYFTGSYRYSPNSYIYKLGIFTIFFLWFIVLFGGIINSIYLMATQDEKITNKIFWVFISTSPIILVILYYLFF